jgi:ABC-2 type transport system ATP-binding protein
MRQRMMLAKTLIPNPHVFLLDEPASGIDPQGRIQLKNILRRLAEEQKTVLISSHILSEMNEFCTSVVIMEKGQIVVGGRIEEVNQRVMGDSFLTVEVLAEVELFQWVIGADERADEIEHKGNCTYEFRFRGDAQAASELLTTLVQQGVRISGFARKRDNLEDLFLKVGSKELS